MSKTLNAVAVYCGSSLGTQVVFQKAAQSVGRALAEANRPLIYGGGSKGIMGVVSGAVLEAGGKVTGVVPAAMVAAGGEGERVKSSNEEKSEIYVRLNELGRESVETIVVDSMHERKVEMAKRSCAFIGLPGGFGTFEEVLEVTTWTQIGLHNKPVILINVSSFFEPLRQLIQNAIKSGFIQPQNASLITFVDEPSNPVEQESFDWGQAALQAIEEWDGDSTFTYGFNWMRHRKDGTNGITDNGLLEAS